MQINGKVRDRVEVAKDAPAADVLAAAGPAGRGQVPGRQNVVKEVVVPGRLVNIVVK